MNWKLTQQLSGEEAEARGAELFLPGPWVRRLEAEKAPPLKLPQHQKIPSVSAKTCWGNVIKEEGGFTPPSSIIGRLKNTPQRHARELTRARRSRVC